MSDNYDGPAMAQHIYRLREQIARNTAEIETLKAERDAAVEYAERMACAVRLAEIDLGIERKRRERAEAAIDAARGKP